MLALWSLFPLFFSLSLALNSEVSVDPPSGGAVCQAMEFSWEGGIAPWSLTYVHPFSKHESKIYSLSLLSLSGAQVESLGQTTSSPFTWAANVSPGTFILQVEDSVGDIGTSAGFGINASTGPCAPDQRIGTMTLIGTTSSHDPSSTSQPGSSTSSHESGGSTAPSSPSPSSKTQTSADPSQTTTDPPPSSSITPTSLVNTHSFVLSNSATPDPSLGSSASTTGPGNASQTSLSSPDNTFIGTGGPTPTITILPSDGISSSETGQSGVPTTSAAKRLITGPIIGGIITAVVCSLVAAFCVIRMCRHRRQKSRDRVAYPFSVDAEQTQMREIAGRTGYPASTFSSWGNHGALTDERALSPASVTAAGTAERHPLWEEGPGHEKSTIESRYAAAFTPRHVASSSSIDKNDPMSRSRQRIRGPLPKSPADLYYDAPSPSASSPSNAASEEPVYRDTQTWTNAMIEGTSSTVHVLDVSSWDAPSNMKAGRHPTLGYPPSYTSK